MLKDGADVHRGKKTGDAEGEEMFEKDQEDKDLRPTFSLEC